MIVAYQGVPGAFAHEACLAFLPGHTPAPMPSFAAVAEAVAGGAAERGMLPVENSRAGPVEGVRELIEAHRLAVLARHRLPVRMHLLALPGATLAGLARVTSHPVALRQCAAAIAGLGLVAQAAANTAVAAQSLTDRETAALASEAAARLYGLEILLRDVQDDPDNETMFAVVRR
jgi:prephenate dehydratase